MVEYIDSPQSYSIQHFWNFPLHIYDISYSYAAGQHFK